MLCYHHPERDGDAPVSMATFIPGCGASFAMSRGRNLSGSRSVWPALMGAS